MDVRERLRKRGLRVTMARTEVLDILCQVGRPISHLEILSRAPELDRVTLYRVLDALADVHLVHRVQGTDSVWRYCAHDEGGRCPGGHPHLLCEKCGDMECMLDQELQHVRVPADFSVHSKQTLVIGVCAKCRE